MKAINAGVRNGLDPSFESYHPKDKLQRTLYEEARKLYMELRPIEQYQLRVYLTLRAQANQDFFAERTTSAGKRDAFEYVRKHMYDVSFDVVVKDIFQNNKDIYSD